MDTEIFRARPLLGILSNIPIFLGALAMALVLSRRFLDLLDRRPALLVGTLFVLTRVVFLVFLVGYLGHVSTDLRLFFQGQGLAVLDGQIPYVDFESWYAPVFPYLMAIPALVNDSPWPFFLAFVMCDLVALIVIGFPPGGATRMSSAEVVPPAAVPLSRRTRWIAAWLYAAAPVTWFFLVRFGQDEALMAAFLAMAYACRRASRDTAAALVLAVGFAATKFTFGVFVIPFVVTAIRPLRFLLVGLAGVLVLFAPFLLVHAPVWQPLQQAGAWLDYGPSLWRLPYFLLGRTPGWWVSAPLVAALLTLWLWAPRKRRVALTPLILLSGLVFLVLAPRVMPFYITPIWPFAALWLADRGTKLDILLAVGLNVLMGIWWYLDTGGMSGRYGPLAQLAAIIVTALVPITTAWWAVRVFRNSRGRPFGGGDRGTAKP